MLRIASVLLAGVVLCASSWMARAGEDAELGREVAVARHLEDGAEYAIPLRALIDHGRLLFSAIWTSQEGGGRPMTKGTGGPISDASSPLRFPRNFNRISAPDANSCAGCHNQPFAGGAGEIVANVFVLGHRFDFATFDPDDLMPTRGAVDEDGFAATLDDIANSRATTSMAGSGYLEMLARQITADLQALRDGVAPGGEIALASKGISYGTLARGTDGSWDVSAVEGLPAPSLRTSGPADPPSLVIHPWHQAGAVVSLRQFTNNAMNHHHGIQTSERFGDASDPDGDGFVNELSRADVTAASIFQATLPVPGRVIPRDRAVARAVRRGERRFAEIGCADCHRPALPLDARGWVFSEPNPYNPAGNLRPGDAPELFVNLNRRDLPGPRLARNRKGVTWVPAFTDFKLHDITDGPDDPNRESLNMHFAPGSAEFFEGNSRFLTKRLWGTASSPPYFHHGKYTTLRDATLAHAGEAETSRTAFEALSEADRDAVIEFLKTLQILPPGSRHRVVDEHGRRRPWRSRLGG